MNVKKIIAPNMRLALKQVREELGPDAIILANRRVASGVELTIASEQPSTVSEQPAALSASEPGTAPSKLELELERMQSQARERAQSLARTLSKSQQNDFADAMAEQYSNSASSSSQTAENNGFADAVAMPAATDTTTASEALLERQQQLFDNILTANERQMCQMRQELAAMKDVLADQLSSMAWGQYQQSNPERASLLRRLSRIGLDARLAKQLVDACETSSSERQNWVGLMQGLQDLLPVMEGDLVAQGGMFAFVGPTGAGKTTTIAKLATRYVMANGADSVAIVTTDTVRIAGHEQLRTLGRILNVPVHVVDQDTQLERVLYGLRHKQLVLVDTAGCGPNDPRLSDQLNSINTLGTRLKTLLVLPASSQSGVVKAAYHSYQTDSLCACVFTKLDEADSLGGVLSVVADKQLPVAYCASGQNIPEDIELPDGRQLIRSAIDLAKQHTVSDLELSESYTSRAIGAL